MGWLSLATFGESWHNNHHAFPTSAFHGLRRRELDLGGQLISALERLGLAWDVVRVSPERKRQRAAPATRASRPRDPPSDDTAFRDGRHAQGRASPPPKHDDAMRTT
jgi:stearoyl-CoA desaturase (delta-9 desaturase)